MGRRVDGLPAPGPLAGQVLDVADTRDPAHVALDALDLLGIFELPAQDYDPAVGVDADRSFRNRPVAE